MNQASVLDMNRKDCMNHSVLDAGPQEGGGGRLPYGTDGDAHRKF